MRTFSDTEARREMTPLWCSLGGPSGCGKTYSALRIAMGIQSVTGGEVFGIDTEGRRMLHYADDFKFRHVPFGPPFRSLDYLDAVRHCAKQGARVIVIDSLSHEHEGSGGYLEYHAAEEARMFNNAAAKFAAWQRPAKERNDLIQGLLQLPISFVFCFRAKEKLKPGKEKAGDGKEKSVMRELGWMPIGGQQFIYEMTVSCLLPPGCNGVPDWDVEKWSQEQKLWIKKPKQFLQLFKPDVQLTEEIGKQLALWSNGGAAPSENCQEAHAATVLSAISGHSRLEPKTGQDQSEPCPLCKNNPPHCKICNITMLWRPAEISDKYGPRPSRWYCPRKCSPPKTTIKAIDWHAILEGDAVLVRTNNLCSQTDEIHGNNKVKDRKDY